MGSGFPLGNLTLPKEPADMGVVMRELLDGSVPRQVIDPAVANMAEEHPLRCEPAETQGGAHPLAFLVESAHPSQVVVDLTDEFIQQIIETAGQAGRSESESLGQEAGDPVDHQAAGKFTGLRAAHAVADGEDTVAGLDRGVADPAQSLHFAPIKGESQKRVLVVGADPAGVGHG